MVARGGVRTSHRGMKERDGREILQKTFETDDYYSGAKRIGLDS